MLVNRVGDIGLAMAIALVFYTFKTVDYATVFALVPCFVDLKISFFGFDFYVITIITLLLF